MKTYNRPAKNNVRTQVLSRLPKIKTFASLVGPEIRCVKELIRLKKITKKAKQYWIENNHSHTALIEAEAKKIGINPDLEYGDGRVWTPPVPLEFINLDFEEGFGIYVGDSLQKRIGPNMTVGGHIFLTLCSFSRNGSSANFAKWFDTYRKRSKFRKEFQKLINEINNAIPSGVSASAVRSVLLAACALNQFRISFEKIIDYKDGSAMHAILIKVDGYHHMTPQLPSFSDIAESWNYVPRKNVRTVSGAIKTSAFQGSAAWNRSNFVKIPTKLQGTTMKPAKSKKILNNPKAAIMTPERKIEYKRRWALADATKARKERVEVVDALKALLESPVYSEHEVADLTRRLNELNRLIGENDANERYLAKVLKGPKSQMIALSAPAPVSAPLLTGPSSP